MAVVLATGFGSPASAARVAVDAAVAITPEPEASALAVTEFAVTEFAVTEHNDEVATSEDAEPPAATAGTAEWLGRVVGLVLIGGGLLYGSYNKIRSSQRSNDRDLAP